MINITDLLNTSLKAELEKIESGMHYLKLSHGPFSSTCNINNSQLHCLLDNITEISYKIRDAIANHG